MAGLFEGIFGKSEDDPEEYGYGGLLGGYSRSKPAGLGGATRQNGAKGAGGLLGGLDPASIGWLSAAAAGFEASGPSRVPISTGQTIGRMLTAGLNGYAGAQDRQDKQAERDALIGYREAQAEKLRASNKQAQELNDFIKTRMQGGQAGVMPPADSAASTESLYQGAGAGSIGPTVTNASRMDAIRPPHLQGQNSAFPFSLNDVTMLKLRGVDLSDLYKLSTDPIKLEGGATYVSRANGERFSLPRVSEGMVLGADGSVSVAPGYLGSIGAIKGAEANATEGAKAKYDLLPPNYIGVDGRPIGGSRWNYLNPQGDAPSVPSMPAQPAPGRLPTTPVNFPSISPAEQAGRDREALLYAKQDIDNATTPEAKVQAQRVYDTMVQRASSGQSVITGSASGAGGGAGRPGVPLLQSEAERQTQIGEITGRQSTQQKLNDNWITTSYNPIIEAGRSASNINASLDAIKGINLQTGWGTEAKAHAASVLTGLGVGPQNAKLFAANVEKFQSVAMDRLLTTLQAQKGIQTEGDASRAQQTFMQLRNTPEANQFISDFARAKANLDARRAQFYQEALPLAQKAGDLNEIDRRWAKIQGSIWSDPVLQRYVRSN